MRGSINAPTPRSGSGVRCTFIAEPLESRRMLSAGDVVSSFGSQGFVSGDLFPGGSASAVAVQADGKVIAAGTTGEVPGGMVGEFALARFNSNGSLDRTFGVDGRVITDLGISFQGIGAVAVQKDGKIIAAGFSGTDFALVRYRPSGQIDKTFGFNGIQDVPFSGQAEVTAIALQPNGKIDVAGSALNTIDQQRFALAQFTTSGQFDSTFGTHGVTTTTFPNTGGMADAMVIQPNGDLVVAGGSDAGNATFDFTLARYTPAGKLDTAFGTGGIVVDTSLGAGSFSGVALKSNGQIIADGSDANGNADVARFQSNGKIDHSFGTNGVATMSYFGPLEASSVLIQKSGDIVVVGTAVQPFRDGQDSTFFAARFTPAGAVDTSFGDTQFFPGLQEAEIPGSQGAALAGALQANDRIVVVGNSTLGDQGTDFALARYTLSGQPDTSFGFGGVVQSPDGINGYFATDIVQRDGKIIVAGTELAPGGEPTEAALVRYNPDGSLDTSFGVDGRVFFHIGSDAIFNALALDGAGDIVAGGMGMDALGNSDFVLVRLHSNGSVDTSFGTGGVVLTSFTNSVGATLTNLAVQPNGDIVAVGSLFISSYEVAVTRYLPNGKLDPSFGSGGKSFYVDSEEATPSALALQSNGKILIAGRINAGFGVLRLLSNGKLDPGFGAGGVVLVKFADELGASANAIAIDSSGDIVVGGSVDINEGEFFNTYYALVRLSHISGKLDSTFGTGGIVTLLLPGDYDDTINSLAIQKDGKIIAGGGTQGPSAGAASVRPALASFFPPVNADVLRFTAKGVLDMTFGQDGVADPAGGNEAGPVSSVSVLANGDILGLADDLFELKGI